MAGFAAYPVDAPTAMGEVGGPSAMKRPDVGGFHAPTSEAAAQQPPKRPSEPCYRSRAWGCGGWSFCYQYYCTPLVAVMRFYLALLALRQHPPDFLVCFPKVCAVGFIPSRAFLPHLHLVKPSHRSNLPRLSTPPRSTSRTSCRATETFILDATGMGTSRASQWGWRSQTSLGSSASARRWGSRSNTSRCAGGGMRAQPPPLLCHASWSPCSLNNIRFRFLPAPSSAYVSSHRW